VCRHRPLPLPGGPYGPGQRSPQQRRPVRFGLDRPTSTLFAGPHPPMRKTYSAVLSCRDGRGGSDGPATRLRSRERWPAAPRRARHHAETPITAQWVLPMSTLGMTTATSPSAACPSPCLETPDAGMATWRPPRGRIAPVPRRTKRCLACNPGSLMTLPGTGSSAHGDPHSPGTMRRSPRALRPSPTAAPPQTDAGVMAPAQGPRIRPINERAADRG
jgi:hypothetical protein